MLPEALKPLPAESVFLIEGLGQQMYGGLNWGDGLITDSSVIARSGLSDPNPFFQELLAKPYRRQVVVAVHVYPPAISKVWEVPQPACPIAALTLRICMQVQIVPLYGICQLPFARSVFTLT